MKENMIQNPIIPGFYPDPSICRVGEDYYICCSSFEIYPGLPIFHSRDLAHWELIGHALTAENDFHVDANSWAGGVMAPTIRYHKGLFYIINCNFADEGNFIVTATNPAGPWSKPHWLSDVPGIDASIFFDDDDTCYIMGTGDVIKNPDGTTGRGIWAAEYDIENFRLIGEPVAIWDSALRVAASPEAPHLYHIGDYYYLLIAEGGTEHYHCAAIARSRTVLGFYEGYPGNPIMTHRHLGTHAGIANVGHADFVQTQYGDWYAVMLASRTIDGYYKNFGRETFLCPMEWERGWPILSPQTGMLEAAYPADEKLPWIAYEKEPAKDTFDFAMEKWPMHLVFWGRPYRNYYRLQDGQLHIRCIPRPLAQPVKGFGYSKTKDADAPVIGRRQRSVNFDLQTRMTFVPDESEEAGLVLMQASCHQYLLRKVKRGESFAIQLVCNTSTLHSFAWLPDFSCEVHTEVLEEVPCDLETVVLRVEARGQDYRFFFGADENHLTEMNHHGDGRIINPEEVGPMVGTFLAIYASGNEKESENEAAFDYLQVQERDEI